MVTVFWEQQNINEKEAGDGQLKNNHIRGREWRAAIKQFVDCVFPTILTKKIC